jgi:nitrate/nitrite transporter NarK
VAQLSPVGGALVPRIGARRLMAAGILSAAVGLVWLAYARAAGTDAETILAGALLCSPHTMIISAVIRAVLRRQPS